MARKRATTIYDFRFMDRTRKSKKLAPRDPVDDFFELHFRPFFSQNFHLVIPWEDKVKNTIRIRFLTKRTMLICLKEVQETKEVLRKRVAAFVRRLNKQSKRTEASMEALIERYMDWAINGFGPYEIPQGLWLENGEFYPKGGYRPLHLLGDLAEMKKVREMLMSQLDPIADMLEAINLRLEAILDELESRAIRLGELPDPKDIILNLESLKN